MKLTFGGVRGSCPVAQPDFMGYGGETTAFLIEGVAGERILIDAGTGIRLLGRRLMETPGEKTAWLFMTHYHLDHVVGLPMLPMIYSTDWALHMAAPDHNSISLQEMMQRILDRPFWPLQVEDLKSGNTYHALEGPASLHPFLCGGIEVRWCPVRHQGDCTAYRFDEPATGASVVIATDVEWGLASPAERAWLESLIAHPRPAELLIMDGQYEDETIARFRGWGHSTWQEAGDLAARMKAGRLLITHHDPGADDAQLDRINALVQVRYGTASLARAGMSLDLPVSRGGGGQ
ncbi:MAG TPA: MBL fold metallo-hydrolase [Kiritimatiellia bacterium]|nr:MBL fold metallo-hydrolase [Kiritimatiellia bacterium]HMO97965.1 MBL fold metallo-hydrolase [Kiritimatiellia bacterium]HMP95316.1 MBL fold metallo-hydrolase [Kiritimatiellia bacterium]